MINVIKFFIKYFSSNEVYCCVSGVEKRHIALDYRNKSWFYYDIKSDFQFSIGIQQDYELTYMDWK